MRIDPAYGIQSPVQKPPVQANPQEVSFENLLGDAMSVADQSQAVNTQDTIAVLTGDINDLHTSMIAMEKADIALQFTMQIRNKILDAYNEIMRMQL